MHTNPAHNNQEHVVAKGVHIFMSELCLTVKQNKADLSFSTTKELSKILILFLLTCKWDVKKPA